MKIINNEKVVCVDIDDTLVMHHSDKLPKVHFTDPHSKQVITLGRNEPNIRLVKEKKSRGYHVIVWSQGGYAWATAAIGALGLEDYVDVIMTKPTAYIDDKESSAWMGSRVWLDPNINYKSKKARNVQK